MKRLIIALASMPYLVNAQETSTTGSDTTILKNIEVVKEYNPVIKEAGKISTLPELKEVKTEKKGSNISVWTNPYTLQPTTPPTLDYATVEATAQKTQKPRYVRVGAGTYTSFLGEIYTPIVKNNNTLLDFYALHNSSFGDVKLTPKMYDQLDKEVETKATDNDTKAKVTYTRSIKNKELSAFVNGGYRLSKYYGLDSTKLQAVDGGENYFSNDTAKQGIFCLGANVRFRSKDYISRWKYDVQANYQLFSCRDDLREHTIHTNLNGAYRFDNSSLHLDFDMHNIIMSLPSDTWQYHFEAGETLNNYTVIKLKPSYYFSGEIGEINVGVKGAFSIHQGKKGAVTPDVYGKVKLIKNVLAVYAGVTGDYIVNNYQNMTEFNPYISIDTRVEDTYMPIDAYVGVTMKIAKRVDMDLHAGYKLIENPYFFVNRCDSTGYFKNTFDVVYDDKAGVFNAGLLLSYNWKERLNIRFNGIFNKWALTDLEEAWHRPKWQLDFEGSYLVTDNLRFRLGYQMQAGAKAILGCQKTEKEYVAFKQVDLPVSHNLYLGADYRLLKWLDLFVNFDNIAAQEYQTWYGYTQHRFNFMGGVSIVF